MEGIPGLAIHQWVPEQMTAPAAIITGSDPYLTSGRTLGDFAVSLKVRLFAEGGNQMVTESLDELIVNVCEALKGVFGSAQASVPGIDSASYATPYLVSDITIASINFLGGTN